MAHPRTDNRATPEYDCTLFHPLTSSFPRSLARSLALLIRYQTRGRGRAANVAGEGLGIDAGVQRSETEAEEKASARQAGLTRAPANEGDASTSDESKVDARRINTLRGGQAPKSRSSQRRLENLLANRPAVDALNEDRRQGAWTGGARHWGRGNGEWQHGGRKWRRVFLCIGAARRFLAKEGAGRALTTDGAVAGPWGRASGEQHHVGQACGPWKHTTRDAGKPAGAWSAESDVIRAEWIVCSTRAASALSKQQGSRAAEQGWGTGAPRGASVDSCGTSP